MSIVYALLSRRHIDTDNIYILFWDIYLLLSLFTRSSDGWVVGVDHGRASLPVRVHTTPAATTDGT